MKINSSTAVQKSLAGIILCSGILMAPSAFGARALIYELDHRFSGATLPGEGTSWATATFLQVDQNRVDLHLKANDTIGTGYMANWWFNFEGSLSTLTVNGVGATEGTSQPVFSYAGNNASLFNNGRDSIRWDFGLYSGGNQDFKAGDELYLSFYSASGLSIEQFDSSIGAGGGPALYSGANISGLPGGATEKVVDLAPRYDANYASTPPPNFIGAPEASSVFLGFLLLAGCVGGEIVRRNREAALAPIPAN